MLINATEVIKALYIKHDPISNIQTLIVLHRLTSSLEIKFYNLRVLAS